MKDDSRKSILIPTLAFVVLLAIFVLIAGPSLKRAYQSRVHAVGIRNVQSARRDLKMAVRNNDFGLARQSLANGAEVSPELLTKAIQNGNVLITGLLLESGADPTVADRRGQQLQFARSGLPIHQVAASQHSLNVRKKLIALLIRFGADPMGTNEQVDAMDVVVHSGDAEIADVFRDYGLPYGPREMATFNRVNEIRRAVAQDPSIIRRKYYRIAAVEDERGMSLLAIALLKGHRELALFLIESGSLLDERHNGASVIHHAVHGGNHDLIAVLVEHGADVDAVDTHDVTALMDCAWNGPLQMVIALIDSGADVNARSRSGSTALHLAISHSQADIITQLMDAGADPSVADNNGVTPLDIAEEKRPAIRQLLQ